MNNLKLKTDKSPKVRIYDSKVYLKALYVQIIRLIPLLLKAYLPVVFLLGIFVVMEVYFDIEASNFTRDPVQVFRGQAYIGMLSNLGILFWMATVSITFFSSILLRKQGQQSEGANFLFYSALITAFLMIDDLFLFHERLFPVFFSIPEIIVYLTYGLILLAYFAKFFSKILDGEFALLFCAVALLGSSVLIDVASHFIRIWGLYLFEDGFKFMGIVTWFLYFNRKSFSFLEAGFRYPDKD